MAYKINVKETAISLLHFQNDIVTPKGKMAYHGIPKQVKKYHIMENVAKALDASRKAGVKVIYVNAVWRQGHPGINQKLFQIPLIIGVRKANICVKGTWGADNPDEVKPQPTDIIVENWSTCGFMHSDLDLILRANGISNLVITGTATNWVVDSTTRVGMELGYNITIIKDCVQSFDDEMHNFAINIELPQLANKIVTLDEYIKALKKA